ncbi:MAG: NusA N-terminal domain-containing protein, partial [Bacteroidota bacterium]
MNLDILLASFMGLPCIVWWLLAGILPFILGWLFGSSFKGGDKESKTSYSSTAGEDPKYRLMQDKINAYEKTDAELKYKIEQLELDLKKCRSRNQTIDMERLMYKEKLNALGALDDNSSTGKNVALAAGAAAAVGRDGVDRTGYGAFFSPENLQIVEGIGPKVEALLKDNGIKNWSDLAAKKPEELRTILVANKLQMMNPDSWPKQAELAAAGKWEELVEYQKFLDGGRGDTGDFETFRCWTAVDFEDYENSDIHILADSDLADEKGLKEGDVDKEQIENAEFGRIAAQAAKQVIVQKVRDAERL